MTPHESHGGSKETGFLPARTSAREHIVSFSCEEDCVKITVHTFQSGLLLVHGAETRKYSKVLTPKSCPMQIENQVTCQIEVEWAKLTLIQKQPKKHNLYRLITNYFQTLRHLLHQILKQCQRKPVKTNMYRLIYLAHLTYLN